MKRLLFLLLLPLTAFAYTNDDTAKTMMSDGTQSDTQSALTYVEGKHQDGWDITIGAANGNYTWDSPVGFTSGMTNSVFIHSAASTGSKSNRTTITLNFTYSGAGLQVFATNGKFVRVSGFIFKGVSGQTLGTGAVNFGGTGTANAVNSFRLDYCRFEDVSNYSIGVLWSNVWNVGAVWGVVDNCDVANTGGQSGAYVHNGIPTAVDGGPGFWANSFTYGDLNRIIFEDCTFSNTTNVVEGHPAIDSSYGGVCWTARYTTFTNYVVVWHGADSAPTSTGVVEVGHCTFIYNRPSNAFDFVGYARGGTFLWFENTVTCSNGALPNQIIKTAIDSAQLSSGHALYPDFFQQIGHGASSGSEVLMPCYVWNNTVPSTTYGLVNAPNNNATRWIQNTHYFLSAKPGYTEAAYPHPLRGGVPAVISNRYKLNISAAGGF